MTPERLSEKQTAELRRFIRRLALLSGEVITPLFNNPELEVEIKSDASPVTLADKRGEEVIRTAIHKAYPGHGIIGEEFGRENEDAEFVWVLDPIDGTIAFVHGCPLFTTLIGLLWKGYPVLGAIHQPVTLELCIGDNHTTTFNERPVRVRETPSLSEATLLATDLANIDRHQDLSRFDTLRRSCKLFRTWADGYGYLMLASGRADIMMDPVMNLWDILPVLPVVRGAGATVTSWEGEPDPTDSCVAAVPALHPHVMQLLHPPQG